MKKLLFVAALAACSGQEPSKTPPPPWGVPITGGTMLVTRDGTMAVVADPDRDQIVTVDLGTKKVISQFALQPNDEPGRIAEDGNGNVHVALRRGGAVLAIDPHNSTVLSRIQVCAEPRGIAWEQATDLIHVACGTGELVSLPATGTAVQRIVKVDRGLRDVVISNGQLFVTRFREAELLQLDAQGNVVSRVKPPIVQRFDPNGMTNTGTVNAVGAVAWKTIALPSGQLVMMHQRQLQTILKPTQGGYGAGCGGGPVEDAITVVNTTGGVLGAPFAVQPMLSGALPVDLAVSNDGSKLAIVTAGSKTVHVVPVANLSTPDGNGCGCQGGGDILPPDSGSGTGTSGGSGSGSSSGGMGSGSGSGSDCGGGDDFTDSLGAPTSVGFTNDGGVAVFYPELPGIAIHHVGATSTDYVTLPGTIGYDAGRAMFHTQTPVGIACASCHPEARDDGLVWEFENEGSRRTQVVAGSIMDRAPYHWNGDMADLPTLMDQVFAVRMAGPQPTNSQHLSLGPWLNRVPAPAATAMVDPQAAARGKVLFNSLEVGCANCHSGPLFTNHQLANVGTGGTFKVPSLVGISARAPYLHDGSAQTLYDRFGPQGGGDNHGHTSRLLGPQLDDLVAYLNTL